MDINKTNRTQLKGYFAKNCIPTEGQFAELIDGMLNQKEDGIAKPAGDPLSIEAAGDAQSLKKAINVYEKFADANPAWTLLLNPRTDPSQASSARPGFCVADGAGNTRLFLDKGTGNLGVGTITPAMMLDVRGDVAFGTGANNENHKVVIRGPNVPSSSAGYQDLSYEFTSAGSAKVRAYRGGSWDTYLQFLTNNANKGSNAPEVRLHIDHTGNVGIGTTTPVARLDIAQSARTGTQPSAVKGLYVTGDFGDADGAEFRKSDASQGIGIGANTLYAAGSGTNQDLNLKAKGTGQVKVIGPLQVDGAISANSTVGIGTTAPRSALDTGSGVMSGAANDYQKAQFTLSGGGLVTWGGPGGYLKWTQRFIAISMERPKTFASGHMNIALPTSASLVTAWDGTARVDASQGIQLKAWEALYAVHTVGADQTQVSFQIVTHSTGVWHAPSNWILVAVVNDEDDTVKLGTGVTVAAGSSYASTYGSSLPKGAIIMWSGSAVPTGWALCDGANGTPDLRNRFIVGAGNSYKVGDTGGANTVTLTVDQMPAHNHSNGNHKYLLQMDGQWTHEGTDNTANEPNIHVVKEIVSQGGNQAHENRPPYYALCFIMKL